MSDDEIMSVFGEDDPDIAYMKLAVTQPAFGRRDLEHVLRRLRALYGRYRRPNLVRRLFSGKPLGDFEYSGAVQFRTLFRLMFETDRWDADILFQPGFLDFVVLMKDLCAEDVKDSWIAAELYEIFAEMADRLAEKIRAKPEGTLCLGSTT